MQLEVKSDFPPYIPLRRGWPSHRSPWWLLAAILIFALLAVGVALTERPTSSQQATDLATYLQNLNADTQSCAGGVHDSLYVLRAIDSGASKDVQTAISVASGGAANCDPASNDLLAGLLSEVPPQSMAKYHLDKLAQDLFVWGAIDAPPVQSDIATVLSDLGQPSELGARAKLASDLKALDHERAVISSEMKPLLARFHPSTSLLALPG